jgi:DNA-binding MarR family transcriptional regulator
MGRYRELIRMLMKYNNLFSRYCSGTFVKESGLLLSAQQWQTLESIIEYEETNFNMAFYAKQLGLPKSTFSKHVKALVDMGLVDKYQQLNNKKNIVLKPSRKGRNLYRKNYAVIYEEGWKDVFKVLDSVSDENIEQFVAFVGKLAEELEPENNKVIALLKLT